MNTETCAKCGNKILLGKHVETDATIALDLELPVFYVCANKDDMILVTRTPGAHVSHYAVCKGAEQSAPVKEKRSIGLGMYADD